MSVRTIKTEPTKGGPIRFNMEITEQDLILFKKAALADKVNGPHMSGWARDVLRKAARA